jgi:hypothetical protein
MEEGSFYKTGERTRSLALLGSDRFFPQDSSSMLDGTSSLVADPW